MQASAEFWIMPSEERWRWQVVNDCKEVVLQGLADTAHEAYEAAKGAARKLRP